MGRVGGRATAPCLAEVCVETQRLDLLLRWQHVFFPYKALTLTVWKPAAKQTGTAAMPGIQIFSLALFHVRSTYKLSERRHITRASMQARCDVQQNIGIASLLWFNPANDAILLYNRRVCLFNVQRFNNPKLPWIKFRGSFPSDGYFPTSKLGNRWVVAGYASFTILYQTVGHQ